MPRRRKADKPLVSTNMRMDETHWALLTELYGKEGRGDVVRQLIANHLRRGTRYPERPTPERLAELDSARAAAAHASSAGS